MKETWRWFGPEDPVTIKHAKQSGASGIVTALHHMYDGREWPEEEINKRKQLIEGEGLTWEVCESIPMHKSLKTRTGPYREYINYYQNTIRNLAKADVKTICYNFMPVVDWTRTNLLYELADESLVMRFDMTDFIAADIYIIERPDADQDYSAEQIDAAKSRFDAMPEQKKQQLESNLIGGLPAREATYDRKAFLETLAEYSEMGNDGLRENLYAFLNDIIPVAEENGVRMCTHPDDPPFSLFGLPRIVSTADDARALLAAVDSPANGLTFCAGSYGARGDNDLVNMVKQFAPNIHFVHLRNVIREDDGSFYESEHLAGDNDMLGLIQAILDEEDRRKAEGREDTQIPMRPDHGQLFLDEVDKKTNPGYSFMGRMKGLAELRGAIHAIETLRSGVK
jgi:mannonate dehydratase